MQRARRSPSRRRQLNARLSLKPRPVLCRHRRLLLEPLEERALFERGALVGRSPTRQR